MKTEELAAKMYQDLKTNLINDFVKAKLKSKCFECERELEIKALIKVNGTYRPFCIDCFKKITGE